MWENLSIPITQFLYVLQCFWMTVTQAGNVPCVFFEIFPRPSKNIISQKRCFVNKPVASSVWCGLLHFSGPSVSHKCFAFACPLAVP